MNIPDNEYNWKEFIVIISFLDKYNQSKHIVQALTTSVPPHCSDKAKHYIEPSLLTLSLLTLPLDYY